MSYIAWAVLGMVGYSSVTLFVKLATRSGGLSAFAVLAIATSIVAVFAVIYALAAGAFAGRDVSDALRPPALFSYAAGIMLTVAVGSLFKALSLGPASVVVPIYGMFILGGSVLGVLALGEPMPLRRVAGLLLCILGVYLVAR